uniref:CBS domain-containing protein n=1 Tax=Panagrolaimus sp. ES5 TaxID=591445 RepID=A0AC34G7Q5_9BILA
IGVIVAHAVGKHLQPSIYDSIVQIKKLPYLPDISHISQDFIGITAEQFMVKDVKFLSHDSTLSDVREIIMKFPNVHTFPICDSHKNQILIGSCKRTNLRKIIDRTIGPKAYSAELARRLTNTNPDGTNISTHSAPSATDLDGVNGDPNPTMSNNKWERDSLLSRDQQQPSTITGWKLRSFIHRKKNHDNGVFGFNSKERAQWEANALEAPLELNEIEFDSAPFQLMERSPLLHVHMLFSLLGLKRAYITKCGRLEGLISRRELRKGIEDVRQGILVARRTSGKLDPSLFTVASVKPELQFKN